MIELPVPDDFHHHLRDSEEMNSILPLVVAQFGRAVVMPNLQPPIRTVEDAAAYRSRILNALPAGSTFEPLMTIYLTDSTTAEQIVEAKASDIVVGAKLYPAGATTNSEFGVTSFELLDPALRKMEEVGLPLLVHGEVTDSDVDVFDRERVFIERVLKPIVAKYPRLRVVMEHITSKEAVDFILSCCDANGQPRPNIGATITAHHLLYSRNALFLGGIRPHMYCLPILKRESHRQALLRAATSGDPRFFLGTDSAPHSVTTKQSDCGCAGIFTGHAALELYAEAFDSVGKIDALPAFASVFGQRFYGLPTSPVTIRLVREDWTVPESYPFGNSQVRPLRAGEVIRWKKV
jgi:dihydroorotase